MYFSEFGELTHGFDDNFIDIWSRASKPEPPEEDPDVIRNAIQPWSPTGNDKDFFFDDEEDPIFQTVPGQIILDVHINCIVEMKYMYSEREMFIIVH